MKMKRLLSLVLCLCMFSSLLSLPAFAGAEDGLYEPISRGFIIPDPISEDPAPGGSPEQDPIPDEPPVQDPVPDEPPAQDPIVTDPGEDDFRGPPLTSTGPKSLSISASLASYEGTYDGVTNHLSYNVLLTVTDSNGKVLEKGSDYSVYRDDYMIVADDYTIIVNGKGTYEGLSTSVVYSVKPAVIEVSANPASKTFGESDPSLTYSVEAKYASVLSGNVSRETGEAVGSYTIGQGSLDSTSKNYTVAFTSASFVINPKAIAPVAVVNPSSAIYTGSAITPSVSVYTDGSKSSALSASDYTVSYSNNINAGTAGYTVSPAAGGNYSFSNISGNFTILKAEPVYTAPSAKDNLKYNGNIQQLINPGYVASPGCQLLYSNSRYGTYNNTIPCGRSSGTYEVWYKIEGNENYNSVAPQRLVVYISSYSAADHVADMIRGLYWLPDLMVDPGNSYQRSEVLRVWNEYNRLSSYDKSNVPSDLYNWLYYLVSNTDYAIISGSGTSWYKGKSTGISFQAIDPKQKFAGISVDGKSVNSSDYSIYWTGNNGYGYKDLVVVTLKPSYLTNLGFGKHNITINYWNGSTSGYFYVVEATGSPPTGDTANLPLWSGLLLMSMAALGTAGYMLRRRKEN